uniref:Zinc finger, CCHC-type n=1 Tax=Tanacetum cinerariifolium TaxID=118510 RepID=A0A6L2L6K6_TANCI|nr:zinc finger, CCHC-type [Tanacetum cinerariifolium]
MATLADKVILSGADNRLPMLEKEMYDSWKSIMELYMLNKQHGRMILESVENGPFIWPSIKENGVTRPKKYSELSPTEAIQADCDIKATNIILRGLPPEVYALVSNHKVAKELWERIQLLGETLREFYLIFSLLLNDMNIYNMKLEQFQVNTKFLNTLPPEWSKFVTDVKLVRDLHTTNIDQIHAYLGQHEFHANEKGNDPIDAINHMVSFLTTIVTSRYPTTNNQLRNSSNPKQQAAINNGRVTLQPIQERQTSLAAGTSRTYTPGARGNNFGKQMTVICYNCKGKGHMSKQYTKTKRKRDDSFFKDKVLLVQAQENGQILHEEKLAFLAYLGIAEAQATQTVITHNVTYQADELDAYESDCDKINTAKVALMANLFHYGSDDLAEVHNHDNVINQVMQAMPCSKRSNIVNHSKIEITSDSNIISYSEYVSESQQVVVQNSNSHTQQDALILSVVKQLKTQVVNCTKINLDNKSVNDTLTAELERYKEHVRILTEGQNVDLKSKDNVLDSCAQSNSVNYPEPTPSSRPTKVEVPKVIMEIFQRDKLFSQQSDPSFDQLFAINELNAQSQEKDMVIKNSKERIKSLSGNMKEDKIKKELEEIETINIELDHRVTKLIAENEHLKQTYKQLYDSIKSSCIRLKEQCDDLINQVNLNSAKNSDLNASLQEKALVITALKDNLRKIKGKVIVDDVVPSHLIDPELLKVDVVPLAPKLRNKRTVHSDYLRHTQEETVTLREIVEQGRSLNPLNTSLDYALGNACPLTRFTITAKVLLWKPIALESNTPKHKVVQIFLRYLDSGCSKHINGDRSQLTNFVNKFLGTVKFGNDHVVKIMGYGDYQIGNVTISGVYFVEGLGHNLFSVRQFCNSDLEVAFRQHTCFIRNLEGLVWGLDPGLSALFAMAGKKKRKALKDDQPLIPIHILEEERIRREHGDYINRMEIDPRQEEIDVVSVTNDVLAPSVDNDDLDEEVDAVVDLRVDNFIQNSKHEYSESEDSDFDNPPLPLPPPEPPDEEFDFEIKISVVRNTIVKFKCIDARVKFDDENDDLSYFMFVSFDKEFSFLSAESEDTIFDPVFTTISNPHFDNDKINSDEINSHVESNSNESTSNHDTEVWDSIKVKHLGADLDQKARLQTLRSELETLRIKPNEKVSDFGGKLSSIMAKFKGLDETLEDKVLVRKLLNSALKKFLPIVATIEQYQDLDEMSFEEAVGRLTAYEEQIKNQDKTQRL